MNDYINLLQDVILEQVTTKQELHEASQVDLTLDDMPPKIKKYISTYKHEIFDGFDGIHGKIVVLKPIVGPTNFGGAYRFDIKELKLLGSIKDIRWLETSNGTISIAF